MWMMSDFTTTNGATRIVSGSHLSGGSPIGEVHDDEYGLREKQVAWDGWTWNAAGVNSSDGPRIGLITFFCGPMTRTLTNYTLGLRSEVKAELSD